MLTYVLHSRMCALFASVVLLLIATPFLEGLTFGNKVLDAGFTLTMLAALHSVRDRRSIFTVALGLAAVSTALLWAGDLVHTHHSRIAGGIGYIALTILAIIVGLGRVIRARRVDEEVLIGAVTIYLLIGIAFAFWFSLIDAVEPQSFTMKQLEGHILWTQYVYLSFTTLTTLGYGDITPLTPFARIVTSLLAVIGVFYQAILVARLVSLYRPPARQNSA